MPFPFQGGTHTCAFNGIPATERPGTNQGIDMDRLENGRTKEIWWTYDTLGLLLQLGVFLQAQAEPVGV